MKTKENSVPVGYEENDTDTHAYDMRENHYGWVCDKQTPLLERIIPIGIGTPTCPKCLEILKESETS